MPQAISYTRFSSLPQSKGSSTERQKELISNWLERNPEYSLSPLSADDKGRSGYRGEHLKHGLGSILDAINNKKIKSKDVLLIEALDRLGRLEPLEMLSLISKIINSGISIITLEDNQEYSLATTKNNQGSLYVLIGKIQQAHDYSDRLSTRIKASYKAKIQKAKSGAKIRIITPMWLNTNGTLRKEESSAVLECIHLYLKGHGTRSILLSLIDTHPCLRTVHPSTLKRWFRNKALIGEWKETQPFTPLIDKETFYKLQHEISRRSKNMSPEQTYALSGIVVCEKCSSRYYYRRKNHNEEAIIYGNCSTYLKRGSPYCNNKKSVPYEVLLYAFRNTNLNHLLKAAAAGSSNKVAEKIEALKSERNETIESIRNIIIMLEKSPNHKELNERFDELTNKKETLNVEILDLESGTAELPDNYTITDFFNLLNDDSEKSTEILNKREELLKDPVMLREALKKQGYRIYANDAHIKAPDGSSYEVIKRSQTHKCYIVKCSYVDSGSERHLITWAAINRGAQALEMATENDLYNALSAGQMLPLSQQPEESI